MITHFFNKIQMILSTESGWLSLMGMMIANYFAGYRLSVSLVVLLVFLDLVWGIASSIKQGSFAKSELARDSISKISVYGCSIISFIAIDKLVGIGSGITTTIICAVIMLVELWSMIASMLIVFPNMPFLRVIRPVLLGEIANKLRMSEDDVKKYLEETNKNERN